MMQHISYEDCTAKTKFKVIIILSPHKTNQLLGSPHSITCKSNENVMRIKEMITNLRSSLLPNILPTSTKGNVNRTQCGEYICLCQSVKDKQPIQGTNEKSTRKKKIPCAVWENTKLFYFLFDWLKGQHNFSRPTE